MVAIGLQLGSTALDSLVALGWLAPTARADPDAVSDAVVAVFKQAGTVSLRATGAEDLQDEPLTELVSCTPWGSEALLRMQESGQSLGYCWDATILRWLMNGDIRPLAHSFALGYPPGRRVLRWFAGMLSPDFVWRSKQTSYAYRLKVVAQHGRRGRRSDNPEHAIRDLLIARHVEALREGGASYEEATAEVAQQIGGDESRLRTVRRAYDRFKPKGQ